VEFVPRPRAVEVVADDGFVGVFPIHPDRHQISILIIYDPFILTEYYRFGCELLENFSHDCRRTDRREERELLPICEDWLAGSLGTDAALTQLRREHGSALPLREFRHCTAGVGETIAKNAKIMNRHPLPGSQAHRRGHRDAKNAESKR